VAERGRGRRVGVGLFSASLGVLRDAGARHVTAYANARNLAALRLHPSAGFVAGSVGLWYHLWLRAGA
jgi:L-amino acid N-acyltransferase YncA